MEGVLGRGRRVVRGGDRRERKEEDEDAEEENGDVAGVFGSEVKVVTEEEGKRDFSVLLVLLPVLLLVLILEFCAAGLRRWGSNRIWG